jgi:CBS domain-containing protein
MEARDIMTKDVVAVTADMPVGDAADLLLRYRIHGAPVVDDAGQLVGMLSFVDLGAREGTTVRDVMVADPVSAAEDAPVEEIASIMLDQIVRRVPIVSAVGADVVKDRYFVAPTVRGLGCFRLGTIKMESAAAASCTVRPRRQHSIEKLTQLRVDVLNGVSAEPQRLAMRVFLERWLEDTVRTTTRESTYQSYGSIISRYVIPYLGGTFVSRVTPAHVQAMLASLEKRGASPHVRQRAYVVLHRAFAQAVLWGMAARNACNGAARPRIPRKVMRVLAPDQVATLLDTARGTRLEALYVLAVTTGLRQGELLGLHWEDIDLVGATLRVCRALQQVGNRMWLDEPKTPRARRTVNLPAITVAALNSPRTNASGRAPTRFSVLQHSRRPNTKEQSHQAGIQAAVAAGEFTIDSLSRPAAYRSHPLTRPGCASQGRSGTARPLADLSDARYLQSCAPYHGTRSRWKDRSAAGWSD